MKRGKTYRSVVATCLSRTILLETVRPKWKVLLLFSDRYASPIGGGRILSRVIDRLRITLGVASILLCQFLASHSEAADRCQRIVGEWGWFIGGKVSFSPNAQARWTPGSATPPASATWTCDSHNETYTVTWQNGFVDTLRLSDDGAQLSGTSSSGVKVTGRRISSAAGTSPAQGTTKGTAPKNGSDGWTPIGPGGFGKQAPVPMGPNGVPQRIGPQGRPPPKGSG